jgi:hypothetical protein
MQMHRGWIMSADEEHTEERQGSCVIQPCKRDPLPELVPVCGPHRSRLRNQLREIPDLCAVNAAGARPELVRGNPRRVERADHLIEVDGRLAAVFRTREEYPWSVASAAVPGQSGAPRVAGSQEMPVPIRVDRFDLLAPARRSSSATRDLAYPEQDEDQVGHLSAATVLDGWCRDFAELRRESTPTPVVTVQCRYLLDRLDWAFTDHEAVDELAQDVGDLWHVLRRTAGLMTPKREHCAGIPCKSIDCDLKTLWRLPGSDYIECESCGALLTEAEYQDWLKLLRAPLCAKRNGDWWCALPRRHDAGCAPVMTEGDAGDVAA